MSERGDIQIQEKDRTLGAWHSTESSIIWERSPPVHFLTRIFAFASDIRTGLLAHRRELSLGFAGLLSFAGLLAILQHTESFSKNWFSWSFPTSNENSDREVASSNVNQSGSSPSHSESESVSPPRAKEPHKSVVLLIGGGCESATKNEFVSEFKRSTKDYLQAGVELHTLFGSPYTSSKIRKDIGVDSKPFHARSFEEEISNLLARQDFKPGDSILIQLNTTVTQTEGGQEQKLCYDIPEDSSFEVHGQLGLSDLRDAVSRLRSKHPEVRLAIHDQSTRGEALANELSQVRGVCTLSSLSAPMPENFDDYFNHQYQKALTHGWPVVRAFESALKDRFLRVRRNTEIPRISGIPSADLESLVRLAEWSEQAGMEWERTLDEDFVKSRISTEGVPDGVIAPLHPELAYKAAIGLTGSTTDTGLRDFSATWNSAAQVAEKLDQLAQSRGTDGSAASLKRTRAIRKLAARLRSRIEAIRTDAETFSQKWSDETRVLALRKNSEAMAHSERDWNHYVEMRDDLAPLFLNLGRLRLRLGDSYRLLRELDAESLIRDESGTRRLEDWQNCADYRLHVTRTSGT